MYTFTNQIKTVNDAQIVDFINSVYRPSDEYYSDSLYSLKTVSMKEIFGTIWKYTNRFDDKTLLSFNNWCNKNKVDLLSVEPKRKVLKTEARKIRIYLLSVLDTKYHGNDKVTCKYEICTKTYLR